MINIIFSYQLVTKQKIMLLGLEDFKSRAFKSKIDLKDISSIIITIVPPNKGKSTDLQLAVSNISVQQRRYELISIA
jgi:hypothetical protein